MFCPSVLFCTHKSLYEFLLFENFELTKMCFIQEQHNFGKLAGTRIRLHKIMYALRKYPNCIHCATKSKHRERKTFKNTSSFNTEVICSLRLSDLTKHVKINTVVKSNITNELKIERRPLDYKNCYGQYKKKEILKAAIKGVIMLQETFDQDSNEFSNGHLSLKIKLFLKV